MRRQSVLSPARSSRGADAVGGTRVPRHQISAGEHGGAKDAIHDVSRGGGRLRAPSGHSTTRMWPSCGSAIHLLDTRSGKVREVLSVAPNAIRAVTPTRDDRRIYFGSSATEADVWLMSRE